MTSDQKIRDTKGIPHSVWKPHHISGWYYNTNSGLGHGQVTPEQCNLWPQGMIHMYGRIFFFNTLLEK